MGPATEFAHVSEVRNHDFIPEANRAVMRFHPGPSQGR
jgi:hypothetical protein